MALSDASPTLAWYARALRRHRTLVWTSAAAALLLSAGVAVGVPAVYRATTVVVATPQPPPGSGREGLRRAPTVDSDARLLTSDRVLSAAAEQVDYPGGLRALRSNVDVTAPATSRVLQVRVTADDYETARVGADAVAEQFLRIRAATDDSRFEAAREQLAAQVTRISERLVTARANERDAGGDDPEAAALQAELTRLQRELTTTRANSEASGFVAEPAPSTGQAVRPFALTIIASGALLGLAGAATVACRKESLQWDHHA